MLPPLPLYIDSTMIVEFRSCPAKFAFEYIHCLRPKGRHVDLVAGGAFAVALEAAYLAYFSDSIASGERSRDRALAAAYRAFHGAWANFDDSHEAFDSPKSFNRTFQAVLDYFDHYDFETDHVRPMLRHDGRPSFEFSFSLPLSDPKFPRHPSGEPFIYCGRFDAFGTWHDRLVIRDEKTTGRNFTKHWSESWNLRNQFLGYVWAAQHFGYDVDTVVVRGIGILKTLFHHVEAIKIYPSHLLDRFSDQLARDLHRLVDCWSSGYFDFDLGNHCMAFGRPCAFMDPCGQPDPSVWFSAYDREVWDPIHRTSTPIEIEDAV